MHPSVSRAFEEIDAAVFSGPLLYNPEELAKLKRYTERWTRAILEIEEGDGDD